jgi:head-tail adaptor
MRVSRLTKHVSLGRSPQTSGDADGFFEDLDPKYAWCAIDPQGPTGEGRTVTHLITMRFHKQVTMDVRIVYADPVLNRDRHFFVRGFQNVAEKNDEMRLICEEVVP